MPIFCAWLRTGVVYRKCAQLGRPVHRDQFVGALTPEDVSELANETLGEALVHLREQAVAGTGWDENGSASLPTYFLNGCGLRFPGVFRRHVTRSRRRPDSAIEQLGHQDSSETIVTVSVEEEVLAEIALQERIDQTPADIRVIVLLHLDGYSHAEIAVKCGFSSARAVEGKIKRYRDKLKRTDGGLR
jgi:hypothetical protein